MQCTRGMMAAALAVLASTTAFCQDETDTTITDVIDGVMLQVALSAAASNGSPDIINIGEGTIDVSQLSQALYYVPEGKPDPMPEETYPIWIIGAGKNKTILDGGGEINILTISTADLRDDMGASVRVTGIGFRNARNPGTSTFGALAIATGKADIMVDECSFFNCHGPDGGAIGAFSLESPASGRVTVFDCSFDSCYGAVDVSSYMGILIDECSFSRIIDRQAVEALCVNGGIKVRKCTFDSCIAVYGNGNVDCQLLGGGDIIATKNSFTKCINGALYAANNDGKVEVSKNTFTANRATGGAAVTAIAGNDGSIRLHNNYFFKNRSTNLAAAYLKTSISLSQNDAGSLIQAVNNVFAGNFSSASAAGIHAETYKGDIELINNTFAYDTSSANDCGKGTGAALFMGHNNATASVVNNVFYGGVCKEDGPRDLFIDTDWQYTLFGEPPDGEGADVRIAHNVTAADSVSVSTSVNRSSNIDDDPKLDADYKLTAGSPAIDAGDNDVWGAFGSDKQKDILGKDRIVDGLDDGDKVVDIGAFEFDGSNAVRRPQAIFPARMLLPDDVRAAYTVRGQRLPGGIALPRGVCIVRSSAGICAKKLIVDRRGR
ncbi:MAG: hypothetical protein GF418_08580 [Chitinivibrionales bacterium]|nr:hypothetical protein [Chitinivibrionales bacterium]MBD3395668.1 hypothetical protein [Chitinivibrionales bacterium]